ncbi:MAG TPA: HD domain-containing protein [Thermoplasmata archaeon]|nr:HD domain-containing protein [Thermoplasmata archaeon]
MPGRGAALGSRRVADALALALRVHDGQLRKDGRTPYIVHPLGVLRHLVSDLGVVDEELACVAVLHDVLEDTPTTPAQLRRAVGARVARLVESLTLPPGLHGESVAGEAKTRRLVADARSIPWEAVLVKLCDRWDNLRDVANAPWGVAKRAYYARQTHALVATISQRLRTDPPPPKWRAPVERALREVRKASRTAFS